MSAADDAVTRVCLQWVAKAEDDWLTATYVLRLKEKCPASSVCFHSQQCVEKYLKAILAMDQVPFPKSHDIEELVALLPIFKRPPLNIQQQALLSTYAISARYPIDNEPAKFVDARQAVGLARKVRAWARPLLPQQQTARRQKKGGPKGPPT